MKEESQSNTSQLQNETVHDAHNMQDFMRLMKVMLELCSEHIKDIAEGGVGRPFNNSKRESQQGW